MIRRQFRPVDLRHCEKTSRLVIHSTSIVPAGLVHRSGTPVLRRANGDLHLPVQLLHSRVFLWVSSVIEKAFLLSDASLL